MWYVYRAPGKYTGWKFATPFSAYTSILNDSAKAREAHIWLAEVKKALKQINWDGTVIGEPYVFLTPTAFGLCPGLLLKQETLGLTFIASQVQANSEKIAAYESAAATALAHANILKAENDKLAPFV